MQYKLMIAVTFTVMTGLLAPSLAITSFATDAATEQSSAIDYSPMEEFHSKFSIIENGRPRVAYNIARKNAGPYLNAYVDYLSEQDVAGYAKDDQLAYWLNVQNALVIQAISFDTKKTNLKKLRGTAKKPGKLWAAPRFSYGSEMLSISDIETRIVTQFDNPNVLYGIYQGVRGAPKISTKSYHGATVHTVLAEAGKTYVNSNGIVRSDNQTAMITPIYLWHKDTLFGGDDAKLIAHVRNHAAPGLASDLYKTRTVAAVPLNYRADNFEVPRQRDNRTRGSVSSSGGFGS